MAPLGAGTTRANFTRNRIPWVTSPLPSANDMLRVSNNSIRETDRSRKKPYSATTPGAKLSRVVKAEGRSKNSKRIDSMM
ncbi:hypothetical protein RJT34_30338 [Clitoria ternatea]|uniref:Uncharacterized protein n=1 Tax=Clitoria ternatea TaxID=43366 RepID=A0AAN9EZW3_CLITE